MTQGKKGTSSLNTLTRAVAGIARTEDDATFGAAVRVLLNAYDDEDHRAGRRCFTEKCAACGGPEPSDSRTGGTSG